MKNLVLLVPSSPGVERVGGLIGALGFYMHSHRDDGNEKIYQLFFTRYELWSIIILQKTQRINMSTELKLVAEFDLADTKNGKITVGTIDKPYGEKSSSVASIAISLSGTGEPDWKVHIPKENIQGVIDALTKAKYNM